MKTNPVIVDLLPELQIVIHPVGVPVVGRFTRDTNSLDYDLTVIRMNVIIGEIEKLRDGLPDPVTFYIHEGWQSFAIIAGVCSAIGIRPRVLVMNWRGVTVDLFDFYHKGGDDLKEKLVQVTVSNPNFKQEQKEITHELE